PQDLCIRSDADIIFREIDAGLEQRDQLEQRLFERRDTARDRALDLLSGDARLVECRSFDEIANRFGPRQIDAAVEERAHRDPARSRQPRSGLDRALQAVPQYDRRAVAGDLNHILGGVRAWAFEEAHYHPVDIGELGQGGAPGPPFEGIPEPEDAPGDGPGV